jgi:hypothetical protein
MSENLNPNRGAALPSLDRFKVNGDFLVAEMEMFRHAIRKKRQTKQKPALASSPRFQVKS